MNCLSTFISCCEQYCFKPRHDALGNRRVLELLSQPPEGSWMPPGAMQMMAAYPGNAVRNMAMLLTRTDLMMNLDVDFVVSREVHDIAIDPKRLDVGCGHCM